MSHVLRIWLIHGHLLQSPFAICPGICEGSLWPRCSSASELPSQNLPRISKCGHDFTLFSCVSGEARNRRLLKSGDEKGTSGLRKAVKIQTFLEEVVQRQGQLICKKICLGLGQSEMLDVIFWRLLAKGNIMSHSPYLRRKCSSLKI